MKEIAEEQSFEEYIELNIFYVNICLILSLVKNNYETKLRKINFLINMSC